MKKSLTTLAVLTAFATPHLRSRSILITAPATCCRAHTNRPLLIKS